MVKIAYCLYGQPRNYVKGFENIKKFVENCDVDFYYHAWTLRDETQKFIHSEYRKIKDEELTYESNMIEKINLLYKPKSYLHEESKQFNFENDIFLNSIIYLNTPNYNNESIRISNTISNFYSKQQVRNLLRDAIQNENNKYDFVITSRFDFLNEINVNLNNINNEKIYVSNICRPRYIFSDAILLLSVDNYLKLFDAYDNLWNLINNEEIKITMKEKYNEDFIFVPESILFANFLYNFKDLNKIEYVNFPNFH